MSYNKTDESLNTTVLEKHPTQDLHIRPYAQSIVGNMDAINSINDKPFAVKDTDWLRISEKEKYFTSIIWPINIFYNWPLQNITWDFIRNLMPVGLDFNTFVKVKAVAFSFHPAINANAQGLFMVSFVPAPTTSYYTTVYSNVSSTTPFIRWQAKKIMLSPNQTNSMEIIINNPVPYEFLRQPQSGGSLNTALQNRLLSYSWGTLYGQTIVPLVTKSTNITDMTYVIRARLIGLDTAGYDIG